MLLLVSIWFRISGCELFLEEIFTYSGFRVLTKRRPPSQAAFGSASWGVLTELLCSHASPSCSARHECRRIVRAMD
jgi:hypothetical protein